METRSPVHSWVRDLGNYICLGSRHSHDIHSWGSTVYTGYPLRMCWPRTGQLKQPLGQQGEGYQFRCKLLHPADFFCSPSASFAFVGNFDPFPVGCRLSIFFHQLGVWYTFVGFIRSIRISDLAFFEEASQGCNRVPNCPAYLSGCSSIYTDVLQSTCQAGSCCFVHPAHPTY